MTADEECDNGKQTHNNDGCSSACLVEYLTTPAWHTVVGMNADSANYPGMLAKIDHLAIGKKMCAKPSSRLRLLHACGGVSRRIQIECGKPQHDVLLPTCKMPPSMYYGNCTCHCGSKSMLRMPAYNPAHSIPPFVGSLWYCDSSNDGSVGNSWSTHEKFTEPSTCVKAQVGTIAL